MVEAWGYPPIDYRISFRRRASARRKIRALIDKHPDFVVVAHGEVIRENGEAFLRRVLVAPLMAQPHCYCYAAIDVDDRKRTFPTEEMGQQRPGARSKSLGRKSPLFA